MALLVFALLPMAISWVIAKLARQSGYEWVMWAFILGPLALPIQLRLVWKALKSR